VTLLLEWCFGCLFEGRCHFTRTIAVFPGVLLYLATWSVSTLASVRPDTIAYLRMPASSLSVLITSVWRIATLFIVDRRQRAGKNVCTAARIFCGSLSACVLCAEMLHPDVEAMLSRNCEGSDRDVMEGKMDGASWSRETLLIVS
jgi:hypothetical protein